LAHAAAAGGAESKATAAAATAADATAAQVRRWKMVALASAFVAVAMVAGVVGWALRGDGGSSSTAKAFVGGGAVVSHECMDDIDGIRVENAQVFVLDANGKKVASSRLMARTFPDFNTCRRAFVVDKIPGGLGIYTLEVGRWRQTVTEVALRGNLAEMSIPS
jgi:hypothetical protein